MALLFAFLAAALGLDQLDALLCPYNVASFVVLAPQLPCGLYINIECLCQQLVVQPAEDVAQFGLGFLAALASAQAPVLLLLLLVARVSGQEEGPWVLVELVGIVRVVVENNDNKLLIAVVVNPVSITGPDGDDVSLLEFLNLLMSVVSESLASLLPRKLLLLACFECFGAARSQNSVSSLALDDVDEDGGVVVDREKEASLLNDVAADGDAGASELVVVVIPELGLSALRLDAVGRLPGVDVAELAFSLLLSKGVAQS